MYRKIFVKALGPELRNEAKLAAGALAGITATLCCFPLDVLRTRVLSAPISQREGNYLAMLARIARKEGLPALYVGCAPALVAMVPSGAVYYWLYDMLKEKHLKHVSTSTGQQASRLDAAHSLLYGALAGAAAESTVYPLEVIRRRMQQIAAAAVGNSGGQLTRKEPVSLAASKLFVPSKRRINVTAMEMAIGTLLLTLLFPVAFADGIEWQAMLKPQGGGVRYNGDATPDLIVEMSASGTYYGQQDGQNDGGACAFGKSFSNSLGLSWREGVQTYIALNRAQYNNSQACGQCLMYRGLGAGIGMLPIPSEWQFGLVDNVCPECAYGSIDLDKNGDGRWKVEWYPIPCNVGEGKFHYFFGGSPNPYWFMFAISNTRVPIQSVKLKYPDGNFYDLARGWNNMWAANGGPFNSPIDLAITSVLGDTVRDTIQSTAGWDGGSQFPYRAMGASAQPPSDGKAQTTQGGYSFVYLVEEILSLGSQAEPQQYALKKVLTSTGEHVELAYTEIRVMQSLRHPNLLPLLASEHKEVEDEESGVSAFYMLFPLYSDFGSTRQARVEVQSRQQAMSVQEDAEAHCSAPYRAPELFDVPSQCVLDERVDVWSLGCLLYFIMYGISPFERVAFPQSDHFPEDVHNLVTYCLTTNAAERPFVDDVIARVQDLLVRCPIEC
ncbi:hypothetical protein COCSUDRAFT_39101 [Coccomyxa subellipsoidea C-169]|uniref:non-specific serine/threonine protein kinase n=1 Tax=Coccomyxa subellipsoidea (strain C-169) TaxID=574566 RepID=I0Z9W4_COCSC|nr:hypothetical protein COCSUDRAFT_39101 [Coccomyxa subellipsoidea C-169]EIE27433.1 hypothetical protein COCSUDRAFT_39101 [Coccomyxa subellipsoidea C-169]|eukprot:XP_005651977.1 hypothetical protein COCSUDRAFT_39101 [Coccomyxa subellipsoidea C-169]